MFAICILHDEDDACIVSLICKQVETRLVLLYSRNCICEDDIKTVLKTHLSHEKFKQQYKKVTKLRHLNIYLFMVSWQMQV